MHATTFRQSIRSRSAKFFGPIDFAGVSPDYRYLHKLIRHRTAMARATACLTAEKHARITLEKTVGMQPLPDVLPNLAPRRG